MNAHLLIDAVVQQTMVFVATLATAGGVRAPLAHVAEQVFADLTRELSQRGVKKKVIADMFGMALRTYHRRVSSLGESRTELGKTVWEAVLEYVRAREPVSGRQVLDSFSGDDPEVVSGVLSDLAHSGLVYRAGRGDEARYRSANEADFAVDASARSNLHVHLVWLAAYRQGPANLLQLAAASRLSESVTRSCLDALVADGRVQASEHVQGTVYAAQRFEVPLGAAVGWEAAVFDHYQALVTAVITKLQAGSAHGRPRDQTGGSTWSLDVWPGHPLEAEAKGLLGILRQQVEQLRERIDAHARERQAPLGVMRERVVFYAGQYVREGGVGEEETSTGDDDET